MEIHMHFLYLAIKRQGWTQREGGVAVKLPTATLKVHKHSTG